MCRQYRCRTGVRTGLLRGHAGRLRARSSDGYGHVDEERRKVGDVIANRGALAARGRASRGGNRSGFAALMVR
jgi:hypothetical protein